MIGVATRKSGKEIGNSRAVLKITLMGTRKGDRDGRDDISTSRSSEKRKKT